MVRAWEVELIQMTGDQLDLRMEPPWAGELVAVLDLQRLRRVLSVLTLGHLSVLYQLEWSQLTILR